MNSELIRQHLKQAHRLSGSPSQELPVICVPHIRTRIGPQYRRWLINETPKFYLQLRGATTIQYPGGKLQLHQNAIAILGAHIPHRETHPGCPDGFATLVVNFRNGRMQRIISGQQEESRACGQPDREYIDPRFRPAALEILRLAVDEYGQMPPQQRWTLLTAFLSMVCHAPTPPSDQDVQPLPPLVEQALQRLHERIGDASLTVATIASELSCRPEHLSRLFSKTMGMPLKTYLIKHRLALAAGILRTQPDRAIYSVAYMAGFSSPGYFCTSFRNHFQISPLEYRNQPAAPLPEA